MPRSQKHAHTRFHWLIHSRTIYRPLPAKSARSFWGLVVDAKASLQISEEEPPAQNALTPPKAFSQIPPRPVIRGEDSLTPLTFTHCPGPLVHQAEVTEGTCTQPLPLKREIRCEHRQSWRCKEGGQSTGV